MMPAATAKPRTVLLIEDSFDDEQLALRAFRLCSVPVMVKVARDGQKALQVLGLDDPEEQDHIDSPPPELVICDVKLPKFHGHEVLRRIRESHNTSEIKVVMFSSSDEEPDVTKCYALGANSYVRKPVGYEEYLDMVCQILDDWLVPDNSAPKSLPTLSAAAG